MIGKGGVGWYSLKRSDPSVSWGGKLSACSSWVGGTALFSLSRKASATGGGLVPADTERGVVW